MCVTLNYINTGDSVTTAAACDNIYTWIKSSKHGVICHGSAITKL